MALLVSKMRGCSRFPLCPRRPARFSDIAVSSVSGLWLTRRSNIPHPCQGCGVSPRRIYCSDVSGPLLQSIHDKSARRCGAMSSIVDADQPFTGAQAKAFKVLNLPFASWKMHLNEPFSSGRSSRVADLAERDQVPWVRHAAYCVVCPDIRTMGQVLYIHKVPYARYSRCKPACLRPTTVVVSIKYGKSPCFRIATLANTTSFDVFQQRSGNLSDCRQWTTARYSQPVQLHVVGT
jgi:hypothetical protein